MDTSKQTKMHQLMKANGAKGKVVVGGSSSVTPVMEKLKEAYAKANKMQQLKFSRAILQQVLHLHQKESVISVWHP